MLFIWNQKYIKIQKVEKRILCCSCLLQAVTSPTRNGSSHTQTRSFRQASSQSQGITTTAVQQAGTSPRPGPSDSPAASPRVLQQPLYSVQQASTSPRPGPSDRPAPSPRVLQQPLYTRQVLQRGQQPVLGYYNNRCILGRYFREASSHYQGITTTAVQQAIIWY